MSATRSTSRANSGADSSTDAQAAQEQGNANPDAAAQPSPGAELPSSTGSSEAGMDPGAGPETHGVEGSSAAATETEVWEAAQSEDGDGTPEGGFPPAVIPPGTPGIGDNGVPVVAGRLVGQGADDPERRFSDRPISPDNPPINALTSVPAASVDGYGETVAATDVLPTAEEKSIEDLEEDVERAQKALDDAKAKAEDESDKK